MLFSMHIILDIPKVEHAATDGITRNVDPYGASCHKQREYPFTISLRSFAP